MERLKQMHSEASLVQEVAAGDAKAASEDRKWARRMGRGQPVFSSKHSDALVTFSMASDDEEEVGPRASQDEWGSAYDAEMHATATEESSEEESRTPRQAAKRARGDPTERRPWG